MGNVENWCISFSNTAKGNPLKTLSSSTYISNVNSSIQEVLGHRYSSHSFRSGIITDMPKSINPKFIKEFIGHSDIETTMRYIRPTDVDLKKCLIRWIKFKKLTFSFPNP